MAHIKELHKYFSVLNITSENVSLWEALLTLDISTFKPIMDEIISGRLTIEDTRKIISNKIVESSTKKANKRISEDLDYGKIIANNLISRVLGNGTNIIKENQVVTNIEGYRQIIADQYYAQYGTHLTQEQIDEILIIADTISYQELDMMNINGVDAKKKQLMYSNYMSYKPDAKV